MAVRGVKKAALASSGVVAVAMALCSGAAACTIWVGQMTVTAVSTGPGNNSSGTVTGYGANMIYGPGVEPEQTGSSMQYCGGTQPTGLASLDQDPVTGTGTIDVTVAYSKCGTVEWFPGQAGSSGAWRVNWLPNGAHDCMSGIPIGTFDVPANARSVTTRVSTVPNVGHSSPTGYRPDAGRAAICADGPGIIGMQVAVAVI